MEVRIQEFPAETAPNHFVYSGFMYEAIPRAKETDAGVHPPLVYTAELGFMVRPV